MRQLKTGFMALATTALAVPAFACDLHGGGGWFSVPSSQWQDFNPRASYEDPAFLGDDTVETAITRVPPRPARPSFSNAADRASKAAKARLVMNETKAPAKPSKPASTDTEVADKKATAKTLDQATR